MSKKLWLLLLLVLAGVPGYYALVLHSPAQGREFPLDISELRALANSLTGDKPTEVRYEQVTSLIFSKAMIMAGDPWERSLMPAYAYQLVYPQQTVIVDTAMSRATAQPDFLVEGFDEQAYQRVNTAMEKAALIVVTHEHMDHIGGVTDHPHLAGLLPALRLTTEQLNNPKGMEPAKMPADVMKDYQPLSYEGLHALAPGVVLIKSPGHTPGAQMVFVQLADGRELLFLGDVSWRLRNVELERERPLFMTLIIGEDRAAVLGEFHAIHALMNLEPKLAIIPGHEAPQIDKLEAQGFLVHGFKM